MKRRFKTHDQVVLKANKKLGIKRQRGQILGYDPISALYTVVLTPADRMKDDYDGLVEVPREQIVLMSDGKNLRKTEAEKERLKEATVNALLKEWFSHAELVKIEQVVKGSHSRIKSCIRLAFENGLTVKRNK